MSRFLYFAADGREGALKVVADDLHCYWRVDIHIVEVEVLL
jgi:hypothetical protein